MPLLSAEGCSVRFGGVTAVSDVSLQVEPGEIVALLGRNGAGKTTLLRALAGVERLAAGRVTFDGRRVDRLRPGGVARAGVALVPEGRGLFAQLSVEDNLRMGGYHAGEELAQRLERVERHFPVLRQRRRQAAGSLSGGEQQQLAIARALMAEPRLLMLDELSLGLAPRIVAELHDVLRGINADGTAILLVEQHVAQALALAGRAYVMEHGRMVLAGSAAQVRQDPRLGAAYLGHTDGAGAPGDGVRRTPRLDTVELEQLHVPLTHRDRRALQTIAHRNGEPVGALVGRLIVEHVAAHREEVGV